MLTWFHNQFVYEAHIKQKGQNIPSVVQSMTSHSLAIKHVGSSYRKVIVPSSNSFFSQHHLVLHRKVPLSSLPCRIKLKGRGMSAKIQDSNESRELSLKSRTCKEYRPLNVSIDKSRRWFFPRYSFWSFASDEKALSYIFQMSLL